MIWGKYDRNMNTDIMPEKMWAFIALYTHWTFVPLSHCVSNLPILNKSTLLWTTCSSNIILLAQSQSQLLLGHCTNDITHMLGQVGQKSDNRHYVTKWTWDKKTHTQQQWHTSRQRVISKSISSFCKTFPFKIETELNACLEGPSARLWTVKLVILSCKPKEVYWFGLKVREKLEHNNKAQNNYQHQMTQMPKTTTLCVCACVCNHQQARQRPNGGPVNEAKLIK